MMNQNDQNFVWLNRDGRWLGHHWDGLEIGTDGALRLAALPLAGGLDALSLSALPAPNGPSGIALDTLGTVYFSEPDRNRVVSISGCDGAQHRLPCMGAGAGTAQLRQPRGLAWSSSRQALLIVDSGNHRVVVFNPALAQVVEIWGRHGSAPGEFDTPWTIAAAVDGSFYISDYGNQRVQKFNATGDVVPQFAQNLAAAKILTKPSCVAAGEDGAAVRIFVLDESAHAVFVVDSDGNPVLDGQGHPVSFGASQLQQPMGLAVIGASVFVGDNALRQVCQFDRPAYNFASTAVGYQGPVAALAAGTTGTLLLLPGGDIPPISLQLAQGYARQGIFLDQRHYGPEGKSKLASPRSSLWRAAAGHASGTVLPSFEQHFRRTGAPADSARRDQSVHRFPMDRQACGCQRCLHRRNSLRLSLVRRMVRGRRTGYAGSLPDARRIRS